MLLYHITPLLSAPSVFRPAISKNTMSNEDTRIPRISMAPSVLDFVRAFPGGNVLFPTHVLRTTAYFGLLTLDLSMHPEIPRSQWRSPQQLLGQKLVPDVRRTHEWWLLAPIRPLPNEFQVIHVDDYELSDKHMLLTGVKYHSVSATELAKKSMPQEAEHVTRKQFAGLLFKRTQSCAWTPAVQAVLNQYPLVKTILSLFFDFLLLCESYDLEVLDHWLDNVAALNDPYVNKACAAIQRDYDAIQNSIIFREYSNGPMEGKNTKTKFVKRQMFGRMSFDVLRIKMLLLESA